MTSNDCWDGGPWSAIWLPPAEVAVRGTVVLLPGRGEPATAYSRLGQRLAVDGYRVVAAGPEQVEERLLRSALRFDPGPQPVVLIGSDSGASTALALSATAAADRIAGVVVAGLPLPDGSGGSGGSGVHEAPDESMPTTSNRSWDEELDARTACPVHRRRLSEDTDVVRGALWTVPAVPHPTVDPQVPVLALHGEVDVISPLPAVQKLFDRTARVRLVVVSGGRHDVLNDAHHRSVAAEIVVFLERLRLPADASPILVEGQLPILVGGILAEVDEHVDEGVDARLDERLDESTVKR